MTSSPPPPPKLEFDDGSRVICRPSSSVHPSAANAKTRGGDKFRMTDEEVEVYFDVKETARR